MRNVTRVTDGMRFDFRAEVVEVAILGFFGSALLFSEFCLELAEGEAGRSFGGQAWRLIGSVWVEKGSGSIPGTFLEEPASWHQSGARSWLSSF